MGGAKSQCKSWFELCRRHLAASSQLSGSRGRQKVRRPCFVPRERRGEGRKERVGGSLSFSVVRQKKKKKDGTDKVSGDSRGVFCFSSAEKGKGESPG